MTYKEIMKRFFIEGHIKLSLIPDELLRDKNFVLELIEREPYVYLVLDETLKSDIEICSAVICKKFDLFNHFPAEIKSQSRIIYLGLRFTNINFDIFFEGENKKLLESREFLINCLKVNGIFIQYLYLNKLADHELFYIALNSNPLILNLYQDEAIDKEEILEKIDYRNPEIFFALQERIQKLIFKRFFTDQDEAGKKRKLPPL